MEEENRPELTSKLPVRERKSRRFVDMRPMELVSRWVTGEGKDSGLAVLLVLTACKWSVHNFLGICQISQIFPTSHQRRDELVVVPLFSEA